MTQYLLSVWHDRDATPEDIYPDPVEREQSYADTGRFNEEIQASGHWVFAGGLHSPNKEQIGGFWVVEAAHLDEALALAARGSKACRGKVEVRPFQGE